MPWVECLPLGLQRLVRRRGLCRWDSGSGGQACGFQNQANCRPEVARDGLDLAQGWPGRRYEYAGGLLTSVTNSEGERVEYAYQDGRLVAVAQPGGEDPLFEFHYGFEPGGGTFL